MIGDSLPMVRGEDGREGRLEERCPPRNQEGGQLLCLIFPPSQHFPFPLSSQKAAVLFAASSLSSAMACISYRLFLTTGTSLPSLLSFPFFFLLSYPLIPPPSLLSFSSLFPEVHSGYSFPWSVDNLLKETRWGRYAGRGARERRERRWYFQAVRWSPPSFFSFYASSLGQEKREQNQHVSSLSLDPFLPPSFLVSYFLSLFQAHLRGQPAPRQAPRADPRQLRLEPLLLGPCLWNDHWGGEWEGGLREEKR